MLSKSREIILKGDYLSFSPMLYFNPCAAILHAPAKIPHCFALFYLFQRTTKGFFHDVLLANQGSQGECNDVMSTSVRANEVTVELTLG